MVCEQVSVSNIAKKRLHLLGNLNACYDKLKA